MIREDPETLALIKTLVRSRHARSHYKRKGMDNPPTVDDVNAFTRRAWATWHGQTLAPSAQHPPAPVSQQGRKPDDGRIAAQLRGERDAA